MILTGTDYFFDVGILLSELGVCETSNSDLLPARKSKLQWLKPILPRVTEYSDLHLVAPDTTICDFEVSTDASKIINPKYYVVYEFLTACSSG